MSYEIYYKCFYYDINILYNIYIVYIEINTPHTQSCDREILYLVIDIKHVFQIKYYIKWRVKVKPYSQTFLEIVIKNPRY